MGRACSTNGAKEMHIEYLWESQKRQIGRPRLMWVDNIKMDLREIGWNGMDWTILAQDRD
jgi:hypothetical protein